MKTNNNGNGKAKMAIGQLIRLVFTLFHMYNMTVKNLISFFSVDENFDVHDIPCDVIWLDIEHTDGKRYTVLACIIFISLS